MGLKTIAATAAQLATIPIVASITASAKHVVNAEHVLLLTFELGEKIAHKQAGTTSNKLATR